MTGRQSIRDSASLLKEHVSGDDSSGSSRLLVLGNLVALLLSTAASMISYGMLPDQIRIHWSLGMGSYYGPEFAPTLLILTAFPVIIAAIALSTYGIDVKLRHSERSTVSRSCYIGAVLATLGVLFGTQLTLIVVNL